MVAQAASSDGSRAASSVGPSHSIKSASAA
jgi:hypothetical protein